MSSVFSHDSGMSTLLASLRSTRLHKIVVGVDYGTTYSGVSYVPSNKKSVDDIVVIARWPNHRDNSWKAPTAIAYATENPQRIQRNHWGFEVSHGLRQYVWTKLLLDQDVDLTEFDDPQLREMYGEGFLKLPAGKTAQDVVEDYLRELYLFTMQKLEQEFSVEVVRTMAIECWITYPAIWSVKAVEATKIAATRAGFASRPSDTLNMITEPEAAALVAMKPHLGPTAIDPVKPGECFLICDCGGGTVDIITYCITQINPKFQYKEICRGMGGKCGSTYVDRNFIQWMTTTFGNAYTKLDIRKRGPGSRFMDSFESAKRNFGWSDEDLPIEIGPIDLELPYTPQYDDFDQLVKLSRGDMLSLFEPPMRELRSLLDTQSNLVKEQRKKIDRFILVGGFGDSAYLNKVLKDWCTTNNVERFTCPTHCQAAIVKGAALRGLEGIRPTNTIARYHYGWCSSKTFREGVDDERHSYVSAWDNKKKCRRRMNWVIAKGQELDENTSIARSMRKSASEIGKFPGSLTLYQCDAEEPPDRDDDYRIRYVGTIRVTFSEDEVNCAESKWNRRLNCTVYKYEYNVRVLFRSTKGALEFKATAYGEERGTASISFDR